MTKVRLEIAGRVARVILAAPKANVLDRVMIEDLELAFAELAPRRDLCAIVLTADGPHFSFGASVEEHLPDQIEAALPRLSALLRSVVNAPAPTIAAIRGQCLGGGLELVLACDLIVAEESAQLGVPEIKLAVFPPAAAALLPVRIGAANASLLALTGRSWNGVEARQAGLVARIAATGALDEEVRALLESDFVTRSPAALRHAARAVRAPIERALRGDLPKLERLYLDELMHEADAAEGIRAFLEKREPRWAS